MAQKILDEWYKFMPRFVKVMPLDYKWVLEKIQEEEQAAQSDQMMIDFMIPVEAEV